MDKPVTGFNGQSATQAEFLDAIDQVSASEWDGLFAGHNPFVRHAFLAALEASGCISAEKGWQPRHLLLRRDGAVVAAMPLYLKNHSYGEFVFDWAWAEAYAQHGLDYYPKLLTAVPFTPSAGPRLGLAPGQDAQTLADALVESTLNLMTEEACSSWNLLFPNAQQQALLGRQQELLKRQDIQFHWRNRGHGDFDDFLSGLRSSRRKNLRKERRQVLSQGVVMQRKCGADISAADWDHFYACYVNTNMKRSGHGGYLNRAFFDRLLASMPEQLMLVMAQQDGSPVACALFLYDEQALYGRYWGCLADVSCLHFETCFYQGIEFCIERGLKTFDPGTQGEHKLLRGFEPVKTCSYHCLADVRFHEAVRDYLKRERLMIDRYGEDAAGLLPFRQAD